MICIKMNFLRLSSRLAQIKLLVLDVDGVLTDGGLFYNEKGEVQRRFDVRDGLGIRLLQKFGIQLAFLSGGKGGSIEQRSTHLGIKICLTEIKDKQAALYRLQEQLGISVVNTAYAGDDLNDLVVRPQVGLLFAPADACIPLRNKADYVLNNKGGHGAVRELAELILRTQGQWKSLANEGWSDNNS